MIKPSQLNLDIKACFAFYSKLIFLESKEAGFNAGATSFYLFLLDYFSDKTPEEIILSWTNKK